MPAPAQKTEHFGRRCLIPALATVWLIGFLLVFFRQTLPNNPSVTRMMIVDALIDVIVGTREETPAATVPSGVAFLGQRLPLAGTGLILLGAAWLQGAALEHLLRVRGWFRGAERVVIQFALGLASFSLVVLLSGLAGLLFPGVILTPAAVSAMLLFRWRRTSSRRNASPSTKASAKLRSSTLVLEWLMGAGIVAAAAWLLLGALSPPTDFDVREYHLQGPKEWFLIGKIEFLAHNVYTSFPFYSEMFPLAGMTLTGDWWTGALAGKFVLACFSLLSATTVYCLTRRISNHHLGLLAVLIFLTTPWTLRISIIAYAEGALGFQIAVSTLVMLALLEKRAHRVPLPLVMLLGVTSGSAMAAKYTGLVTAVVPSAVLVCGLAVQRRESGGPRRDDPRILPLLICGVVFLAGTTFSAGPWLLRNLADTGNPVYPLGWSVFGGADWDAETQARWKTAHSPTEHAIGQLPQHALDVAIRNDWTSPLLFGLAIPALALCRRYPGLMPVALMALWQLTAWWAFTHRIDRFWVPTIPLLAVVAAHARLLSTATLWRVFFIAVVVGVTLFNTRFCTLPLVGYHAGLQDLSEARHLVIRSDIRQLNDRLSDDARVLMVGEAEVFDCTFPLLYNTVFDTSLFEALMAVETGPGTDADLRRDLRLPADLRDRLRARGMTHVFVNWAEILRYRLPGSYGYTEFVQPDVFRQLVDTGVLAPPENLRTRSPSRMSATERSVIATWQGVKYLQVAPDQMATIQLYPVSTD